MQGRTVTRVKIGLDEDLSGGIRSLINPLTSHASLHAIMFKLVVVLP